MITRQLSAALHMGLSLKQEALARKLKILR